MDARRLQPGILTFSNVYTWHGLAVLQVSIQLLPWSAPSSAAPKQQQCPCSDSAGSRPRQGPRPSMRFTQVVQQELITWPSMKQLWRHGMLHSSKTAVRHPVPPARFRLHAPSLGGPTTSTCCHKKFKYWTSCRSICMCCLQLGDGNPTHSPVSSRAPALDCSKLTAHSEAAESYALLGTCRPLIEQPSSNAATRDAARHSLCIR
jgi:hypothetical protein